MVPSLSEALARRGKEGLASACDLCFRLHLAVLLPALAFVALRSEGLVELVFGTSYHPSSLLLAVFALLTIGGAYAFSGPAVNVLYASGGEKAVVRLRVLTGCLNVVLDILLIPTLGVMGAILATGLSVLVTALAELILAKGKAPIRYPITFAAKLTLATGVAVLSIMWFAASDWPAMAISGVIYFVVLIAALLVMKPLAIRDRELATYTNKYVGAVARYF